MRHRDPRPRAPACRRCCSTGRDRARTWAGESLPPGMAKLMRSVFGEDVLSEDHHRPAFGTRSVWGSADLVETDFLTNPLGEGWLLDRARFDADARERGRRGRRRHRRGPPSRIAVARPFGLAPGYRRRHAPCPRGSSSTRPAAPARCSESSASAGSPPIGRSRSSPPIPTTAMPIAAPRSRRCAEGWWYTTPLPGGRRVLAYLTDEDLWRHGAAGLARASRRRRSTSADAPDRTR